LHILEAGFAFEGPGRLFCANSRGGGGDGLMVRVWLKETNWRGVCNWQHCIDNSIFFWFGGPWGIQGAWDTEVRNTANVSVRFLPSECGAVNWRARRWSCKKDLQLALVQVKPWTARCDNWTSLMLRRRMWRRRLLGMCSSFRSPCAAGVC